MKVFFKVEQSDLVGNIKDFPIEVVEKMIEEQVKQGNCPNVEAFQHYANADVADDGFTWNNTEDGDDFWMEVIDDGNFELFFKKYPKRANLVYIVGNSEIGEDIIKTLEKYGGINKHDYNGGYNDCIYYIDPNNKFIEICDIKERKLWNVLMTTYTPIEVEESVLEVTMEEIAKKFGVDVTTLRIKK